MASSRTPAPDSTSLSVVIVNYRSWPDVEALVSSLAVTPSVVSGSAEIVVVDNASGESVPASLLESRPGIRLLLRDENSGFAAGVNAGWRSSRSGWLLVLNPDLIADSSLIERVLDRIGKYGDRPEGSQASSALVCETPMGRDNPPSALFPACPGPSGSS